MTRFTRTLGKLAATLVAAFSLVGCTPTGSAPTLTFTTSGAGSSAAASVAATPEASAASTAAASSAPSGEPTSAGPADVAIHLSEWSVGVPTTIAAGSVNLSITNIGKIPHELLVFKSDLAPSTLPLDSHGNIIEDGPGVNLVSDGDNIDPGGTQSRQVDLSKPGQYIFVCNIPGHFKAGMFTVVNVTPTPPANFVAVALNEWHVAVESTLKAGKVNIEAANFGTIQHELLVFKSDVAPSAYPVDAKGDIVEDDPGINLLSDGDNINPQGTQTRTVDLSQPATYLFVCNIPGHFKAGMYTAVTVAP
jgi:uncharacterized cupredoxin-like copper-binding protein